jgi:ribose 5-phosphate isomerase A
MPDTTRLKERAGRAAAELVEDGMRVGLGTGSTVHWTIMALGERGGDITCVATSTRTERLAREVGLRLLAPDDAGVLDVAIDGADEVDPNGNLIKGGGGALTREKVVAQMAERFVVVVDQTKVVPTLGAFGVPLEVLSFAPGIVAHRVRALGASAVERALDHSDNGNPLLLARFGLIADVAGLARELADVPGLIEHGLFLAATVHQVLVASPNGVSELPLRR